MQSPLTFGNSCAARTIWRRRTARRCWARRGSTPTARWTFPNGRVRRYDGPAMRAIALLRWRSTVRLDAELAALVDVLLRADLRFTRHLARSRFRYLGGGERPALLHAAGIGAGVGSRRGLVRSARRSAGCGGLPRRGEVQILDALDGFWREDLQFYKSRILDRTRPLGQGTGYLGYLRGDTRGWKCRAPFGAGSAHACDAGETGGIVRRRVCHQQKSRRRPRPGHGPLRGRCLLFGRRLLFFDPGGGGVLFQSRGALPGDEGLDGPRRRYLQTVRAYTPQSGELSEQFDQHTGAQRSAQQLAWSYAAFISCAHARRQLIRRGE